MGNSRATYQDHNSAIKSAEKIIMSDVDILDGKFLKKFISNFGDELESGCIEWRGRKDSCGYGEIGHMGKTHKAHRISWILRHKEAIYSTDFICHTCDNPSCVNPDHLFKANNKTNLNDRSMKIAKFGETNGVLSDLSELSTDDVLTIRARVNAGHMYEDIAKDYGMTPSDIVVIHSKDDWPWLV